MDINKIAIALAGSALLISFAALVRKETEIATNREILRMLAQIDNEIQFAKIIDHYEGED